MLKPSKRQFFWLLLIFLNALAVYANENEWNCPKTCSCKWVSGRKQATCENQGFDDVPMLSDHIQALSLDNNRIHTLRNKIFHDQKIVNLQKLSLRNSSIETIEKNAFLNLSIVIEIDLNFNNIAKLDPNTFRSTEKLRMIYLNGNKIEKIDEGLFSNLIYIQLIELNDNQISSIHQKAFVNLPKLTTLKLSGNRLTKVRPDVFDSLPELRSLPLKNNPWNCDCHMREFVVWFKKKNLYTHPTQCSQPSYLENVSWNSIDDNSFACKPEIVSLEYRLDEDNARLYLSCKVTGDPKPETNLMFNSRILNNSTNLQPNGDSKYSTYESGDYGSAYRFNVTVYNVLRTDYGVYVCSAKNDAGLVETNVSFTGESPQPFFPFGKSSGSDVWVLLLCLVIGILCALVLIFMLCFLCCRRTDSIATKKPSGMAVTTNGDLTHHIIMEPEQQKTLLTAVNPVQKPPRKYDSSPQSDHGGTELTELNRNLLDDCSVQGGGNGSGDMMMDDRRSTTSLEQLSSCNSQDNLLLQERFRPVATRIHPPDLLAFSSRRLQASPAGSSVSNDLEATRFRALHSPVRSPIYQVHPYTPPYDTLPYSRTQSPFSPNGSTSSTTPIIAHRQGYVTIPRRPRVSSWSRDVSTPTSEKSAAIAAEPVYDNLGPRTTADGSSVLSLPRRVSVESPVGRVSRPQAPSPLYTSHTLPHKAKLNHVYLSIRQNEEPQFHPVNENGGVIRPLPLPFVANGETDTKRSSWAQPASRATPETGTLKRPTNEMNGTSTPPPSVKAKVPPKPPPKPKKNGPLFEDEGEDGTEV